MRMPRARARGFTLLEVLVAISIFALIGIASYRVLSSVVQANERLAARVEQTHDINRAFWVIQQDVEQLMPRNVRNPDGSPALTPNYLIVNNESDMPLLFTRGGRANPLGLQRSGMQRVAYRVDHHPDYEKNESPHYHEERWYLLRYTWAQLDGSGAKENALVQVLLPDVESLNINVLTKNGLEAEWPLTSQVDAVPMGLQIEFVLAQGDALKRSYLLW